MRRSKHAIFVVFLAVLSGCRGEAHEDVLARVGDEIITADEFQLNYEFGHAHLRGGEDPRRRYLTYMIYERVMAEEAERLGLDTAAAVAHSMRTLREELLVERVFDEHVLAGIEVSDDEINDSINRSAVSFKFRFIPTFSEQQAHALRDKVFEHGFDDVLAEVLESFSDLEVDIGEVTSTYVKAEDVQPDLLEAIQDLEIGSPSEPVSFGSMWYVFEVMDVKRERLSDHEYAERAPSVRTQIYNQKAVEAGAKFVASTMEPRNVATKRVGFNVLVDALWAWYSHETPARNLLHYIDDEAWDEPFTRKLVENYEVPLVSFDGETWTIQTFLEHFTPGRYIIRPEEMDAFRARIADVIALVVRDHVFLEMAEREDLDEDETYRRTLALWKSRWMFQQFKQYILDNADIESADIRSFYERENSARSGQLLAFNKLDQDDRARIHRKMALEFVERFADSLSSSRYNVEVNEAMLDTLQLGVNDRNRFMTVHLLKSNSNKQPLPIVDPNWVIR